MEGSVGGLVTDVPRRSVIPAAERDRNFLLL